MRDSTKKQGLKQGCSTASFLIPPIHSDSSSFASLSILWLVATTKRIMSTNEHHNQYCKDISPFRIGVFCHKWGKDDFGGNTRSLSSHVQYCKPNKSTKSNLTIRNQQDKVALLLHDSGTDLFLFLVRKRKDPPQSVHHVQPKLKEGLIVSHGARPITSRSILCEDPSDVFDIDLNTTYHEGPEHESYQPGIVDTSLIPSKES